MPYNLPPPWDPGYAIPNNVRDEGLERTAYVTKWMPRGTYDAPVVGTGGYVVPKYVLDEGYGQGTHTTKWQPRGTYNGPIVPQWIQRQPRVVGQQSISRNAAAVTFQRAALSGDTDTVNAIDGEPPMPKLFEDYGRRAAEAILRHVRGLTGPARKAELKRVMDAIDPSLWRRTADITRRYVSKGLAAAHAFHLGLSRALATGIAAEMVHAGAKRSAPQPRSLLGLGCYGCSAALGALGATRSAGGGGTGVSTTIQNLWMAAATTPPDPNRHKYITVGPWTDTTGGVYDGKVFQINFNSRHPFDAATATAIRATLTSPKWGKEMTPAPANEFWQDLGIAVGTPVQMRAISPAAYDGKWSDDDDQNAAPVLKFKHPVSGSMWGVFLAMLPNKTAPRRVQIYFKWLPVKPWYTKALDWIKDIPANVYELAEKVVDKLADMVCQVATSPSGPQAGAAAGVAIGGPGGAQAGAAGAQIAASLCAQQAVPVPPFVPPPPPSSNLLPLAIVGGGALAAILLLKKRKAAP